MRFSPCFLFSTSCSAGASHGGNRLAALLVCLGCLHPLTLWSEPQTVGISFKAISLASPSESTVSPPDTTGDVGASQILVAANGRIKAFDHSGGAGPIDMTLDGFFESVRGGHGTVNPRIRHDRLSGRWFVIAHTQPPGGPNRILLAVSSGPTLTGADSFAFHQFQIDTGATPEGDVNGYAGALTFGVDAHALYVGASVSNAAATALLGSTGFVINKSDLLAGALDVRAFRQLANSFTEGPLFPVAVHNDDPNATEGYFIGVDTLQLHRLMLRRVSDPGGEPSVSGNIILNLGTGAGATGASDLVPHFGAAADRRLSGLDDRLTAAMLKRNRLTGQAGLWTTHNFEVNAHGNASTTGGRVGSRWYEIRELTGSPVVFQSGTLFDPSLISPRSFWIPTIAMSGQGHAVLGCSMAGLDFFPSAAVAGRLAGDAAGTLREFAVVQDGLGSYSVEAVDGQSWGRYSQTVVDPNDDMTMWTFQEYCDAENSWGVRVVQLLAPPPATPVSATPSSIESGSGTFDITVTGISSEGSAFFDPGEDAGGPGFGNRISAGIDGGGIIVNSVTFNGPTSLTLNVTVTSAAPVGPRTVTVTDPDGQSAVSAPGIIEVVGGPLVVSIQQTNAADILIRFNSDASKEYRVVWRDELDNPGWATLVDNIPGTGAIVEVLDENALNLPQRFYRVEQNGDGITAGIERVNGDIESSFNTVAGRTYRVQWRTPLENPFWITLADNIAGTGGVVTVLDPGAAELPNSRWYRVEEFQ